MFFSLNAFSIRKFYSFVFSESCNHYNKNKNLSINDDDFDKKVAKLRKNY